TPEASSFCSTRRLTVDFPEPDRPVNHTTQPFWPRMPSRSSCVTSAPCQWMFLLLGSLMCVLLGEAGRSRTPPRGAGPPGRGYRPAAGGAVITVALDAMGGDSGLDATVAGAAALSLEPADVAVLLVGDVHRVSERL